MHLNKRNTDRACVPVALALVGLVSCIAATCASASDSAATAQARKAIQAVYDRQAAAVAHKDVNAFFAHVAPDALNYDTDGSSETVAQGRRVMGAIMAAMKEGNATSVITSITLTGADSAIVTVKQHTHMVVVLPNQPASTLVQDDTARDNWVKTAVGWTLKRSQNLVNRMTVNGKIVKK